MVTREDLKDLTMRYFSEKWNPEKYIQELLPGELGYLMLQNRVKNSPSRILVQLVGFSWDPLFISLCKYKPEKLVLILNKFYNEKGGAGKGDEYIEFIEKLKYSSLIEKIPEICPKPHEPLKNDTPEEVFQFLQKHILPLLNRGEKAVIDITGAKKSMVSGAYLFASYTNCPVSYVDYDEYSEKYRRPIGYTCRINELENPSELFRLNDWERIRNLYGQYSFKGAVELIRDIRRGMERFSIEGSERMDLLEKYLGFYGLWDNGDFRSAWNVYQELASNAKGLPCPHAVEKLHNMWPDQANLVKDFGKLEGEENIEASIYLKDDEIVFYSVDELAKIERLIEINEDFRSALLRATGLTEFLLKARIVRLWMEEKFVLEINGATYSRKDLDRNELLEADAGIIRASGVFLFLSLRWKPAKEKRVIKFYLKKMGEVRGHRSQNAQILNKFWKGISDLSELFHLRNKAIHFCLSIPRKYATDARRVAVANLSDFREHWVNHEIQEGNYEAVPWDQLLDICGIDFLPRKGVD
jgi:hypothetical protein